MRRYLVPILFSVLCACTKTGTAPSIQEPEKETKPIELTKAEAELSQKANDFSLDLYRLLYSQNSTEDLLVSPLSAATDLSMLASGAEGLTREQLVTMLGAEDNSEEEVQDYFQKLCLGLSAVDATTVFKSANSAWFDKGFEVKQEYAGILNACYDADVRSLDFSSPDAAIQINGWCSEKTEDKISTIVTPDNLSNLQALVLNAVYFKAEWAFEMGAENDFLITSGSYEYMENEAFQLVALPYGNGQYQMMLAVPKNSFSEMVSSLDMAAIRSRKEALVKARFPKFTMSGMYELTSALSQMGATVPFSQDADFSRISDENIFIGSVMQKTFIDVNEKGTEAAAVTGAAVGMDPDQEWIEFNADGPFLFMIYENSSNAILFIGQRM